MNKFDSPSVLRRPFASVPNPEFLYRVGSMERALQETARCIERFEGVACIVGNSGLGKSMACQALYERFHGSMHVVHLNSARLCTRRALLQNILFELGLPYRGMEEGELRLSLAEFLRTDELCPNGVLLLVDEAHTLPSRLLEEIRLLTNQVVGERVGIRLVLAGTARLEERLATAPFESLNQRIVTRCYLEPLNAEETRNYIRHQLDVVHSRTFPAFQDDALQVVYTATGGVPRLINQLCDHALVLADANGLETIDPTVVEEAWADLQQLPAPWHMETQSTKDHATSSTVIEFGELDDPSDEALAISAAEPSDESPTSSNDYASRINPLLESDDNDLLDEHFAPRSKSSTASDLREDRPSTLPFVDSAEAAAHSSDSTLISPETDSLDDTGEAPEDVTSEQETSDPAHNNLTWIHEADTPATHAHDNDVSALLFSGDNDVAGSESTPASLPPLPERTDNAFEDVHLEGDGPQLTTDYPAWSSSDTPDEAAVSSFSERDMLAPTEDFDTELELPEVEEGWSDSALNENESITPPTRDQYDSWLAEDSEPQVSFFETTEPTEAPLTWTSPGEASEHGQQGSMDAGAQIDSEVEPVVDQQDSDSHSQIESLYAAFEPEEDIADDPSFEFVQGVEVDLPLGQAAAFGAEANESDAFVEDEFQHGSHQGNLEAEFSTNREDASPHQVHEAQPTPPAVPTAANPFDEMFEEELEVEPLYSSTLDQNRSSIPASWSSDVNANFNAAIDALEPVSNDPREMFPLAVNVQQSPRSDSPSEIDSNQSFNPFAGDRTPASDETQEADGDQPSAEPTSIDPWRYPVISDSVFGNHESSAEPSIQNESPGSGLTLHRDEPLEANDQHDFTEEQSQAANVSELAYEAADELDMHASLEESRYSGVSDASQLDDDDIDERILREIVSFRDVTSFDPALDPVMPEFRPSNDDATHAGASDDPQRPHESHTGTNEQTMEHDLPEIVLVDPVVPTEAESGSQETQPPKTGHHPEEDDAKPAGKAHREDYRSLFDRLKGQ